MIAYLAITFTDTINLGAIVIFVLGIAAAAVFTIRANIAKVWREAYEGEKETVALRDQRILGLLDKQSEQSNTISELQAATNLVDHQRVMREYNDGLANKATAAMIKAVRESEERIMVVVTEQTLVLRAIAAQVINGNGKD